MKIKSRKALYPFLAVSISFLAMLGGLYVLHLSYVSNLSQRYVPDAGMYKEYNVLKLAEKIGYLKLPPRDSSFINFQHKKKEKIRIGVFGDSNTYGAEVDESQNYPAHLQRILGEEYEVINFGMNWYSLDQAYILFDAFYDQMQLDYVVLGPRGLYKRRTTSFNHTNDNEPYYLHSRFVLDVKSSEGYALKEKKPLGEGFSERFRNYYRFIPHIQYILYDTRAPGFLRSLEYYFNVQLMNPFYYFSNVDEEVNIIHSKILERFINKVGERFLFLHNRFEEDELAKRFSWKKSKHIQLESLRWKGFPWISKLGHFTGFGNALVAAQASSFFTQRKYETSTLKVVGEYSDWDDGAINVYSNGREIGSLSLNGDLPSHMIGLNCSEQNIGTTLFFPSTKAPAGSNRISGFTKTYSGKWLTIFTGDNCLVDYQRKELLIDDQFENSSSVLDEIALVSKNNVVDVKGRKMSIFSSSEAPLRIVIDRSFGEELLTGKEVVIEVR